MTRAAAVLAGAATAAMLLTSAMTAVSLSEAPRTCTDAVEDVEAANGAHQDALERFDDLWLMARSDPSLDARVEEARLLAEQAKRALGAAKAERVSLCHNGPGVP